VKTKQYQTIVSRLFLLLIAILATMALHPLPSARATAAYPPLAATSTDDRWSALDSYVEQERQAAKVPGLALAIVQGDQIVHLTGFGQADPSGRVVTGQTPFSIGSATKSFTALAVMQLVEAGKLELDAPVQRYLPWFRVADPEASARITVRHLLHHTSGLPRGLGIEAATVSNADDRALEALVRSLSTAELTQPVGTTWQYSNAGYATLGLLVQTVSGQSYERYVEEHIFAPLQMQRSFTVEAPARQAGLASGHRYWFGRPVAGTTPFPRGFLPAGHLMSSAQDMAHYLIAQLGGGRYGSASILSPSGIAEMQRGAVAVPGGGGAGYDDAGYGMGWFTGTRNGVAMVSHPGDTADFHADVILMPKSRSGIVMLMNSNNRVAGERMRGIAYGVASLLHAQQPAPIETNSSVTNLLRIIVALAAVQAIVMVGSAITLRRFVRRTAEGTRGGWMSVVRQVVLPLLLYLPLALVFLLGVPATIRYPWPALLLFLPDVGWVALIAGALALGWSIIRTGVVLSALLRRSRLTAIAAPAGV
jgi:CubicO group peptidase (beta-lactamase class C family)